jgi:hypothetical protein
MTNEISRECRVRVCNIFLDATYVELWQLLTAICSICVDIILGRI